MIVIILTQGVNSRRRSFDVSFIYCIDEQTKDILLSKGYKLLKQESMQNQIAWVFQYKPQIQFDVDDKTKYFTSNTMRF